MARLRGRKQFVSSNLVAKDHVDRVLRQTGSLVTKSVWDAIWYLVQGDDVPLNR